MRKKFFLLVVTFVCIAFVISFASVIGVLAYSANKVQSLNASLEEIENRLVSAKNKNTTRATAESDFDASQKLYEQCYAEIIWQNSQMNLLYCAELEHPVIRAVAENNWNLIEDAFIFNISSKEDLDIIEISPCASGIKEFSYLPADDMTSESKNPPELGWIPVLPNEQGNYLLPLKGGEEIAGNYYTIFKYVIYDYTYYGMICLSTIF